jgi:hypothetical protein
MFFYFQSNRAIVKGVFPLQAAIPLAEGNHKTAYLPL